MSKLPSVERSTKEQANDDTIGYVRRRVDVKLTRKHGIILQRKMLSLQNSGARLQDGTEVSDYTKTVLWILENMK